MEKILQKRITFFTKIYFTLLSISLLVLIYKVDSEDSRQDMNYILQCKKYSSVNLSELETKGTIENKIYSWLINYDSLLWNENRNARLTLKNILVKEYGASSNDLNIMKGIGSGEADFNESKHNFNLIGIDTAYRKKIIEFNKQEGDIATVENCLLKIKLLSIQFSVVVLKSLDADSLRHSIDSLLYKPYENNQDDYEDEALVAVDPKLLVFGRVKKVKEIGYRKGQFFLSSVHGGTNPQYSPIRYPDVPINGVKKIITVSSYGELLNIQNDYTYELSNNTRLYNRLNKTYGKLYIDDCIKLLSEENSKSFKSISILGFQFSRQRLLFVFLFFFFFASGGIYFSVLRAKKLGLKVISNSNEEDVLFMLIENKLARFFIWCLVPLLVLLMNFEFNISSLTAIILTILFFIIILFLNIKSFFLSNDL